MTTLAVYESRMGALGDTTTAAGAIGAALRRVRSERSVTLASLARLAGLHRANLRRIERGDFMPSLHTVLTLARALRVPPSELLSCLDGVQRW